MSTRTVIPPLTVDPVPGKQSYEMLESRLKAAETDTRQLLDHLGSMGFEGVHDTPTHPYEPVSPFKGQVKHVDHDKYEKFKSCYESIVSRVCKTESVLQSLKLNLVNLQGDRNLNHKQDNREIREKFQYAREAYEQEIGMSQLYFYWIELNSCIVWGLKLSEGPFQRAIEKFLEASKVPISNFSLHRFFSTFN